MPYAITAQTGTATSEGESVEIKGGAMEAITYVASDNMSVGEEITIEAWSGSGWTPVKKNDGSGDNVVLGVNNLTLSTSSPGRFRVNKPSTANAVSVWVEYLIK